MQLIALEGQQFDVGGGDLRTIAEFGIGFITSGSDNAPTGLSNDGTLAFRLEFTDFTSGVYTATIVSGADFDGDGAVDGEDLAQWRGDFGVNDLSDADGDGDSDGADFLVWQRQFGAGTTTATSSAVPEPTTRATLLLATLLLARLRFRIANFGDAH